MLLYHGSTDLVQHPEIRVGDIYLDFGVGFYTTTSFQQAERWARIKMRRKKVSLGFVSIYEFDLERAQQEFRVKRFSQADHRWLEFVVGNRQGILSEPGTDLHIGPVADDQVYQTIRLFETGILDTEDTIKRLKTEVLQDQWALHTPDILSLCRFVEAKEIREEVNA